MMVVKLSRLGLVLCLALPVGALLGCGGGGGAGQDAKHAQLKPGEMPAGGSWTGVYYDKMYGELHLLQDGANGNGAWRTEAGDKWGEMHGKIDGDLFRFEWTERTIGQVGSTAVRNGKGYFKFTPPAHTGDSYELHGEWGLGSNEVGTPWNAVKMKDKKPDLKSVRPDEVEGQVGGGGGWDETGGEKPKGGEGGGSKTPHGEGE